MLRIAKWTFLWMLIGHLLAKLALPSWPWLNCLVGTVISWAIVTYLFGWMSSSLPWQRRSPVTETEMVIRIREMQVKCGPRYLLTEDIPLSENVMGCLTGEERVSNIPRPGINIMIDRFDDNFEAVFALPGESQLSRIRKFRTFEQMGL